METGSKLRILREKARFSQEHLALELGVDQKTIHNWEKGASIKSIFLPKLSNILNVPIEDLLDDDKNVQVVNNTNNKDDSINAFEVNIKASKNITKTFQNIENLTVQIAKQNELIIKLLTEKK